MTEEQLYYQGLQLLSRGTQQQLQQAIAEILKRTTPREQDNAVQGLSTITPQKLERLSLEEAKSTLQSTLTILFPKIQKKQSYTIQQNTWNYLVEQSSFQRNHIPSFARVPVGTVIDVLKYTLEHVQIRCASQGFHGQGIVALREIEGRLSNRTKALPSLQHLSLGLEIIHSVGRVSGMEVTSMQGVVVKRPSFEATVEFFGKSNR